jgi:hypothetical protein
MVTTNRSMVAFTVSLLAAGCGGTGNGGAGLGSHDQPAQGSSSASGADGGQSSAGQGSTGASGSSGGSGSSSSLDDGSAGSSTGTGSTGSTVGGDAGSAGSASGAAPSCASLPAVTDYSAVGPFADAKMFASVGPNSNYTLFRPDTSLGQNGFKHPIVAWGNGISTTPDMYQKTLPLIASHGFVIIGCNDTQVEEPCLAAGLDWLVAQNTASGPMQGKLDTSREAAVGYSWGGGAAVDTSVRPNIKATVSLHGMPPRQTGTWSGIHAPLLLFTSTGDNFVTASGYVTPNYMSSTVQTFYATLSDSTAGHLYVVDQGASICVGSLLGTQFGNCGNDVTEHAPTIAWLRLWVCDDANAKKFFYGDSCTLCQSPWTNPQRKDWK